MLASTERDSAITAAALSAAASLFYVYSVKEDTFVAVADMPADLPPQLCAAVQHLHQITAGAQNNSQCMLSCRLMMQC